jgi:hypothetical protein
MPGDPVVGGSVLRRPAIQSPDFVHGQQGWSISADGTAEFRDVILPAGTGGVSATFAAAAPLSPRAGDLWYNTAAGLQISQWDGSAWVPYQVSAQAINPVFFAPGGDLAGFYIQVTGDEIQFVAPGQADPADNAGSINADTPGDLLLFSGGVNNADVNAGIQLTSQQSTANTNGGKSNISLIAETVTLNTSFGASIPYPSAGITTVAQLVAALQAVAILS